MRFGGKYAHHIKRAAVDVLRQLLQHEDGDVHPLEIQVNRVLPALYQFNRSPLTKMFNKLLQVACSDGTADATRSGITSSGSSLVTNAPDSAGRPVEARDSLGAILTFARLAEARQAVVQTRNSAPAMIHG